MAEQAGHEKLKKPSKSGSSIVAWMKKNPTKAKIGGAVVLVVVGTVVAFGFLSGGKETTKKMPPPAAAAAKRPGPPGPARAAKGPAAATPGKSKDPTAQQQPGGTPEAPEVKPKAQRPEDLAEWKPEDYLSAKADGDSKLAEAVPLLGAPCAGQPKAAEAAQLLAKLLEPPPAEDETETKPRPRVRVVRQGKGPKLIETVVAALDANADPEARRILEQLLAGDLPTEDPDAAVEATLKTLAANPCSANEGILFRAVTAPENLRGTDDEQLAAEDLRQKAFAAVQPVASVQFRLDLARYLLRDNTPPEQLDTLGKFLQEKHPSNVSAQLYLYRKEQTPPETKATLEEHFIAFSSQAMGRTLEIPADAVDTGRSPSGRRPSAGRPAPRPPRRPPAGRPAAKDAEPPDPDLPYRLARQLWSPPCVAMIEEHLVQRESLEAGAQLVVLAGTIPVPSMRSTVHKTLQRHWEDGSADVEPAGLCTVITDPALLLTLKALPRRETTEARSTRPGTQPKTPGTSVSAVAERRVQAEEDWMVVSEKLVHAWCERFHAAGLARAEAARAAGEAPDEGRPANVAPFTLHPEAKVTCEYHAMWPGGETAKLSGITPAKTAIHYVRIEETGRLKSRLGFYRRQLRSRESQAVDQGTWLDSCRPVPQTNRMRSIDALFTHSTKTDDQEADVDEELVIEILSIETVDPAEGSDHTKNRS